MAAGQRLAKSLVDMLGHAQANAQAAALPGVTAAADKSRTAFMEAGEKELAKRLRPLFAEAAEHPDTPEEVRDLLRAFTKPGAQFDFIVVMLATAVSVFGFAGAIAQPIIDQVGQDSYALRPNKFLSPAEAAAAFVRGELDYHEAAQQALGGGINEDRFKTMVGITGMAPGAQELGEMLRRGIIDDAKFTDGIAHGNLKTEWADELAALRFQVLPAAEAVAAAVQSVLDHDDAAKRAELSGIRREDFDVLFEVAGNPPGFGEMLELWRRGKVDEATVRRAIAESRTKTKYTDALLNLRTNLPSSAEAIAGEVQGQLDHATAVAKYEAAGGDPADYDWLFGVAGDPIAIGQALDLWKRELIDEATVDQVIRESRVKPKYTQQVKLLATRVPPLEQTGRLMHHGVWSFDDGVRNLEHLGFAPDMARALAQMYVDDSQEADNEFAKGEVRALYRAELIDHQRAHDLLVALGKTADYADYMLALDDAVKSRAKLDRNVNVVRTKYLAFRIDEAEASETLDAIGVQPDARGAYIDEWDALREATTRDLTEAQLATALKRGLITGDEYRTRLVRMGYTEPDADLMLAIRGEPAP